ncbi:MAG: lysylphosphatidylglycerol synthase transmembrane domain-containing protein [Patescibacteria group bacterium]
MKNNNFTYKVIAQFVFLLITVVFIIILFGHNADKLKKLLDISVGNFLVISGLVILTFAGNGIKNVLLLLPFNVRLRTAEWFGLSVVNSFWNYLPFQGGLVAKGLYLKRQHSFPYTEYVSTVSSSYLITFFSFGFIGCVVLLMTFVIHGTYAPLPFVIYGALMAVSVAAVIFLWQAKSWNIGKKVLARYFIGTGIILKNKKTILRLMLVDVVMLGVYVARLAVCFTAVGVHVDLSFIMLVAPIALLSIFVTITPGGLVVREALIGLFAFWYSLNVSDIVVGSLLDRTVMMIWVFALGAVFNYLLSKWAISGTRQETGIQGG